MQSKTNPFLVMAALYLTAGALAVAGRLTVDAGLVAALPRLRWLTIHFVTIGGMTQALFGALPALVRTAAPGARRIRPSRRWLQFALLNVGYPFVLLGMAAGSTVTAVAGATLVIGAVLALLWSVIAGGDGGLTARFFRTAPGFLVVGILAAFGMLLGLHGPGGYFGSIEAHVHANVWGFLALVVAGALVTLLGPLLDADLRYPRLVPVTYWGLALGASGLVAGPWLAVNELTIAGLAVYVVGTAALLANVVGTARAGPRGIDSRVGLVLGAYVWLVFPVPWAPLVLLFPEAVPGGAIELAAIDGLVFGWMLQLAMAFLPLVAAAFRGASTAPLDRRIAAAAERLPSPSWLRVAGLNLGLLALWLTAVPQLDGMVGALRLSGYALIGAAWLAFLASLWRATVAGPAVDDAGAPVGST